MRRLLISRDQPCFKLSTHMPTHFSFPWPPMLLLTPCRMVLLMANKVSFFSFFFQNDYRKV